MLKQFRVLFLGLLSLMVACPGPIEPGYKPDQPVDQNSLGFGYVGETSAVAGQWRISWGIDRSPAVTAPTRIRFSGPGTLVDTQMNPKDLSKEYDGAGGLYLPPRRSSPGRRHRQGGLRGLQSLHQAMGEEPRLRNPRHAQDHAHGFPVWGQFPRRCQFGDRQGRESTCLWLDN